MTRKLKGISQYVNVEPHQGAEITKLLGHIISNPYSPTDYCISTDQHPYLPSLQESVTKLLQKAINAEWSTRPLACFGWSSRTRAIKAIQESITKEGFQNSLREGLIECLESDDDAFRRAITIRRIESIIMMVLQRHLLNIVRSLLDEINAMRGRVRERFSHALGASYLPNDEARTNVIFEFENVLQGTHSRLMNLEGTINRRLLPHAMQTFPRNQLIMSDLEEGIPIPNRAIRVVLEEVTPSFLDMDGFPDSMEDRLRDVMGEFRTLLPDYISNTIRMNRPTDNSRSIDRGIRQFNCDLERQYWATIHAQNELRDSDVFVRNVQNQLRDHQLHETQQAEHTGRRQRIPEALEDLRQKIRQQIDATISQHFTAGSPENNPERVTRVMDSVSESKLEELIKEIQQKICVSTKVLKAENFLTSDQAEFLERDNTQRKNVIIRKVGQYPDIFRFLYNQADYRKKLDALLHDRGAAYLITSTYSYLEFDQGYRPFHESCGLSICGMAAAEEVPFIGTGYPGGLLQCGLEKFVARDEVLFGLVIHKITLGHIKGALFGAHRLFTHVFSREPQLDVAHIKYEPHSIRPVARAF